MLSPGICPTLLALSLRERSLGPNEPHGKPPQHSHRIVTGREVNFHRSGPWDAGACLLRQLVLPLVFSSIP